MSPSPFSVAQLAPGVAAQVAYVRSAVGCWIEDELSLIELRGDEAAAWLHGQCTQDILGLDDGQGREAAFLTPRGQLVAHAWIARSKAGFFLIVPADQATSLAARFDAFIFREAVTVTLRQPKLAALWLQGPKAAVIETALPALHWADGSVAFDDDKLWARRSRTGEAGRVVYGDLDELEALQGEWLGVARGLLRPYGDQAAEVLRLEAGIPRMGQEVDGDLLLPETPWMEPCLGLGKGCYSGQEVVERLRSKGSPKQAMVALLCAADTPALAVGTAVQIDGRKEGRVVASTPSPTTEQRLHWVLLKRRHRRPDQTVAIEVEGKTWEATVAWLPVHPHRREGDLADALVEAAHGRFADDANDDDPAVVELLRRALAVRPDHCDALELLGVALQRRGELEEAKVHIATLLSINPESVMGWTNMSRLQAALGEIEAAEASQGQATMLAFKADLARRKAARDEAQIAQAESAERQRRMAMFREVLSFDPDDLVARFGLAKALFEEADYEAARSHLEAAVAIKPDYSAAWLLLGRSLEKLGDMNRAIEVYEGGVAAAARRGELQPMRSMQARLAGLVDQLKMLP